MKTPEQIAAMIASQMTGCDESHGTPAGDIAASMDTGALSGSDVLHALADAAREGRKVVNTHTAGCRPDPAHPGYWYCTPEGTPHQPSGPGLAALIADVRDALENPSINDAVVVRALVDALDPQTPKEK